MNLWLLSLVHSHNKAVRQWLVYHFCGKSLPSTTEDAQSVRDSVKISNTIWSPKLWYKLPTTCNDDVTDHEPLLNHVQTVPCEWHYWVKMRNANCSCYNTNKRLLSNFWLTKALNLGIQIVKTIGAATID